MGTGQRKKKWEERVKDVEMLASWYKKKPLCSPYRPQLSKLWQPSSVWKLFHRQAQALNFIKTCKEDVHVFAMEKNATDMKRVYLVTTYTELWFYYNKHHGTSLMHSYEVIPEETVCKLYFDLEFYKPTNPRADGKQMVANLMEFVCEKLEEHYGVKCSAEDVLNLDSSTEKKFSCHLIFQLHNAAFKNNVHIGNFVRTILQPAILLIQDKDALVPEKQVISATSQCCKITTEFSKCVENQTVTKDVSQSWQQNSHRIQEKKTSQWKENPDLSFLIVNGKQGEKQLFVDLVYTKNRNFRLFKSSKASNGTILDIAEDNKFVPKSVKNICTEQQYFFSSLICNIRYSDSLKILFCDNPEKKREKSVCLDGRVSSLCLDPMGGYQCSPYPEIDSFVVSLVSKDNVQGGIRRWNYFSLEQLLVYDISNYRWCWNIGRAHKSNNIMIVVDLKKEIWYQKCHDPVCRAENFKSECFPLPAKVCLPFLFKEDEEYVYAMDEYGNIEEKASTHIPESLADGISYLTAAQANREPNKSSSVKWDDETDDLCFLEASEDVELAKAADNFQFQGNNEIDDLCFLEAFEDVELAEAADSFQLQGYWIGNELPDELLADALRKHEVDEMVE
ncbi:DNA-directed primase/polymerase protein isoform X2 [Tiliqua scincoides]|uniref:DNA-directed primase/polymerase protein isoform X2 n=1 Tax=Tiliqua scincoides TaxID=71010 RepID=UPI0034629E51